MRKELKIKKLRLKVGDNVGVLIGKDRGKEGKILALDRVRGKVIVEGLNIVKKTFKKQNEQDTGGIRSVEAAMDISNVALVCSSCNKKTRVGYKISESGKKQRQCKKCGAVI